jgi:hypothetical protein
LELWFILGFFWERRASLKEVAAVELTGFKARLEAAVEEFLLVGGGGEANLT